MKYLRACIIAFAMYSKFPMPKTEWEEENMKYVMCFFPFVGIVVGGCFYLWGIYGKELPIGTPLYAAVLTMLPILATGGIHMDGFLDTLDALSSWQVRERRLEILKDPHAGAFAVIGGGMYFLAYYGFASELTSKGIAVTALGFILSRCLSGYGVTALPCAKDSGLAATFANGANKKRAGRILLLETGGVLAVLLWVDAFVGGMVVLAAALVFFGYRRMSREKFGGITGDLAGWFLQVCELVILMTAVAAEKLATVEPATAHLLRS